MSGVCNARVIAMCCWAFRLCCRFLVSAVSGFDTCKFAYCCIGVQYASPNGNALRKVRGVVTCDFLLLRVLWWRAILFQIRCL